MARFVELRKGGGGKVAINPDLVTQVRSSTGAFTDIFFNGQQVAVEGAFEDIVALLAGGEAPASPPPPAEPNDGMIFSRVGRV